MDPRSASGAMSIDDLRLARASRALRTKLCIGAGICQDEALLSGRASRTRQEPLTVAQRRGVDNLEVGAVDLVQIVQVVVIPQCVGRAGDEER